jgi:hypothetical protein
MKESVASFLSNVLSVILGIVITFTVQGIINRSNEKREVRSALNLVRTELVSNAEDIGEMSDYLKQELRSAEYFLSHLEDLDACPPDSVSYHSGIIFADASITLSDDALELLKMSSLFQRIGDIGLAMKIIRAYDSCASTAAALNRHVAARDENFDESVNERTVQQYASGGNISIKDYLRTPYGLYSIRWLTTQGDMDLVTDVTDIEEAVDAIGDYLQGRRRKAVR